MQKGNSRVKYVRLVLVQGTLCSEIVDVLLQQFPRTAVWVLCLGWVATAQAGINVALAGHLNGASLLAATISVSLTGLVLAAWSSGAEILDDRPAAERKPRVMPKWWKFMGGLVGFLYLGSSVILVPRMGFSLFFVLLVSGSIAAGVGYDHYGILGVPVAKVDRLKIAAVTLCVIGVLANVLEGVVHDAEVRGGGRAGELSIEAIVAFAIGCTLPLQGLLNRSLGTSLRRPIEAATVQCFVNAACSAIGYGISIWLGITSVSGMHAAAHSTQWWNWIGGFGGVLLVYSGMTFIAMVGVGPFFVLITLGQLSSSLAWDSLGTFAGGHATRIGWERYVGAACVMGAFLLLTYSRQLSARRRGPSAQGSAADAPLLGGSRQPSDDSTHTSAELPARGGSVNSDP